MLLQLKRGKIYKFHESNVCNLIHQGKFRDSGRNTYVKPNKNSGLERPISIKTLQIFEYSTLKDIFGFKTRRDL